MQADTRQGARGRIVITRPVQDGRRWAEEFQSAGFEPVLLPLIDIAPAPASAAAALSEAWASVAPFRAVMFVSANAVDHFFAARPDGAPWPDVRAWAPGLGTVRALRQHGVTASLIDGPAPDASQFDSESLWAQVRGQIRGGDQVLIVRGGDASGMPQGRDWLAGQVVQAGGSQREVVAYVRQIPQWTEVQIQTAIQAAADGSVWLFSSSEAVANLGLLLPGQGWQQARAVATHPRIAAAARKAGFGEVRESRPGLAEIVASIESPDDH